VVARTEPRTPLSRERVLRTAVAIADANGVEALTMRRLGEELGAEAMSLYYHVANKNALLDGIVEVVAAEINDAVGRIDAPSRGLRWKSAMRQRILSAREVMLRHRWAPAVIETRTTASAEVMRYQDGLVAVMLDGGFSPDLCHHALHTLGSRALGFAQELFNPGGGPAPVPTPAELAGLAGPFPHIAAMLTEVAHDDPDSTLGWCDDQTEFEFGLDLILDGLDRMRRR